MKWYKKIVAVIGLIVLVCCGLLGYIKFIQPVLDQKKKDAEYREYLLEQRCIYRKSKDSITSVFPFSLATRIEIIAYDSSGDIMGGRIRNMLDPNDSMGLSNISARKLLTKGQADTLFSILHDYRFSDDNTSEESAACYNPRHAILFYLDNTLIEYLEICFECKRIEFIKKESNFGIMCSDKWCYLTDYFKRCGMQKNFPVKNYCDKSIFTP